MYKKALTIIFIVGIFVLGINGAIFFAEKDANEFCSQLSTVDTPASTRSKAQSAGYDNHERNDINSSLIIVVPTQDSPFLRFACVATFKDGLLFGKEILAAD